MCTVVPFIEGETMHPEDLAGHPRPAGEGRRHHARRTTTRPPSSNEIHVFDMIREYLEMARGVDAPFPDDMDWMLGLGDDIEQAMKRNQPRPSPATATCSPRTSCSSRAAGCG